ncbi:MAG TPA: hypothetical protein VG496_06935 [Myxococcales bacterium]|nr:hypothetical protein [Myxococcales bacterium]
MRESRLSSIEVLTVAFTAATTFVLGFGYWTLSTRQNEQDAKLELQMRSSAATLAQVERKLDGLERLVRRLRHDPDLKQIPGQMEGAGTGPTPSDGQWIVLLATVLCDEVQPAQDVANARLTAAQELRMVPVVTVYRTRLKRRFVVALDRPGPKSGVVALAAEVRRKGLAPDAYAERFDGWEFVGTAPFPRTQEPWPTTQLVERGGATASSP